LPPDLDLSEVDLSEQELERVKNLLRENVGIFKKPGDKLGGANLVTHSIETESSRPINHPPFRASPHERAVIDQQIDEMVKDGVAIPSKSPWASRVVLVNKKTGGTRFCVDYKRLNDVTKKDSYPLPRIDDSLSALGDCKYFSTFDFASGNWKIQVNSEDREKTAFISHKGLFEFTVMPFGLCNAPATFQRYMDSTFAGLKWVSCLIYSDDLIVFLGHMKNILVT